MQDLLFSPWLLLLSAVNLAVWAAALWLVVKSSKFCRKWLWTLLSLASFSLRWHVSEHGSVSVGLPLGAAYIIGFWRYGPQPTSAHLAKLEARRARARRVVFGQRRLLGIRISYGAALVATLPIAYLIASGELMSLLISMAPDIDAAAATAMLTSMSYVQGVLVVALGGLFAWLAYRPSWWGKLISGWAALSWLGFSLVCGLFASFSGPVVLVLVAALLMLSATIALQILDPRFSGPRARVSPA